MFVGKNSFVPVKTKRTPRRPSELERTVHRTFRDPPQVFTGHKNLNELFIRIYWNLREVQFKIFYKDEDSDTDSLVELQKIEPPVRPDYDQLMAYCHGQFSRRWVKYMYAKFKNECPSGRMKLPEFKKLIGVYIPDRISDAYLERMFNAFCYDKSPRDQITFKDLIECLVMLYMEDARTQAEWTMRLINGRCSDRVYFPEFNEFVKSVFMLVGKEQRRRTNSLLADCIDEATYQEITRRSMIIFKELDVNNQGYLTIDDFEHYFSVKEPKKFLF